MLRIITLTPLRKNHAKETFYTDMNSDHIREIQGSRLLLNAVAHVLSQASSCGICDGQSGTATAFTPCTSDVPCQYYSTSAPY
jgi:hypothetical protein